MNQRVNQLVENNSIRFTTFSAGTKQNGISLIEVLIAMFILAFGALAIVNLQTASAIAINSSTDHFTINKLSQGIVEQLKADTTRATTGDYNTDFSETEASANAPADIAQRINEWKAVVARSIPQGEMRIECNEDECDIVLKWHEQSHAGVADQTFNIKTPI